jgi:hypothetical protein
MRKQFVFVFLCMTLVSKLVLGQVNPINGSMQFNIPVFQYDDSKAGLQHSLSLNYNSGNGLYVNAQASNVGQNWDLIGGGYITRQQNGEPDDQNSTSLFPIIPNGNSRGFNEEIAYYANNYQSFAFPGDPYSRYYVDNYFPNGFMYSEFPVSFDETVPSKYVAPKELSFAPILKNTDDKKWKLSRRALTDRQQDIFSINVNGMYAEFVIGKDGSILLLNDSKLKVSYTTLNQLAVGIRTRINSFQVIDLDGIVYKFDAYEQAEVGKIKEISNEGDNTFKKVVVSTEPTNQYTIQRWVITEIVNPSTNEKIVFNYEDKLLDYTAAKIPSYTHELERGVKTSQIFEVRSRGKIKRLTNIIYPDKHKVTINYQAVQRKDVETDYAIKSIEVSYDAQYQFSYELKNEYFFKKDFYDYVNSVSPNENHFLRLALKEVQKKGQNIQEPPYVFTYYTGAESSDIKDIVPPRESMAQDYFGYYNKSPLIDNDISNHTKETIAGFLIQHSVQRQIAPNVAKLGLLKSIQNPFGGVLEYTYEQNAAVDFNNVLQVAPGVRVSKVTQKNMDNVQEDVVTEYKYILENGQTSGWGYETATVTDMKTIRFFKPSDSRYKYGGVQQTDIGYALNKMVIKQVFSKVSNNVIRTLALKTVQSGARTLAATLEGDVLTQATTKLAKAVSTGASIMMPLFGYVLSGTIDRIFLLLDPTDDYHTSNYYLTPLNQNRLPIQYSRVEILNTSLVGGLGKMVNEYTKPQNYTTEIQPNAVPYTNKQRYATWRYGLPIKTTAYDNLNNKVTENINTYTIYQNNNDNTLKHKSCLTVPAIYTNAPSYYVTGNINTNNDFNKEYYTTMSGRAELTTDITRVYKNNVVVAENTNINAYNNDQIFYSQATTNSKNEQVYTKSYYANDYQNITPEIIFMKQKNILAAPLCTESFLVKNGITYLVGGTVNEFTTLPNGEIRLYKVYAFESKTPVDIQTVGIFSSTQLLRNPTYFKLQQTYTYSSDLDFSQTQKTGGDLDTKIYNYDKRFVVAEVMNAQMNEVAYTSFETDMQGGWTYDQSGVIYNKGITGKKYYNLNGLTITRNITNGQLYTVSFWTKGIFDINSCTDLTLKYVGPTFGDWTLRVFETSGNSSSVTIGSSCFIDELRLHPVNAKMFTSTYDVTKGKTSICDINNRIVYYEYDAFGKLLNTKDESGNIIKTYEYHFKNN